MGISEKTKRGLIIGGSIVAGLVALTLITMLICCCRNRYRRNDFLSKEEPEMQFTHVVTKKVSGRDPVKTIPVTYLQDISEDEEKYTPQKYVLQEDFSEIKPPPRAIVDEDPNSYVISRLG